MAQAMIDKKNKLRNVGIQTGDSSEFCIYLSKSKTVRLYNSKSYKDYVLSFNLSNSKKFIISKSMWKIFRRYIPYIDKTLLNYNGQ